MLFYTIYYILEDSLYSPEQSAVGRGRVERLVERHDPIEELRREGQRRHGGQEAVVAKIAGFHAAPPAATATATAVAADGAVASRFAATAAAATAGTTAGGHHHAVAVGHQPGRFRHKLRPLTHFLERQHIFVKVQCKGIII